MTTHQEETHCRHMGYIFRLAAWVLLYAPSHRQDNTYQGLCYTIMEHEMNREIAQWARHVGTIRRPIAP